MNSDGKAETPEVQTDCIDAMFLELSQFTQARTRRELDMKTLIVRLSRRIEKLAPDDELPKLAMDYLKRSGMNKLTDILR